MERSIIAAASIALSGAVFAAPPLLSPLGPADAGPAEAAALAFYQSRPQWFKSATLAKVNADALRGSTLSVGDIECTGGKDIGPQPPAAFVWRSSANGTDCDFYVTADGSTIFGNIRSGARMFQVFTIHGTGNVVLVERTHERLYEPERPEPPKERPKQ